MKNKKSKDVEGAEQKTAKKSRDADMLDTLRIIREIDAKQLRAIDVMARGYVIKGAVKAIEEFEDPKERLAAYKEFYKMVGEHELKLVEAHKGNLIPGTPH